ncbi:TetR/AcrR family transcriptional regulator [Amycolatopsis sp. cg5]|uniref:TetR/AcrR family transcriptional regulator n=1 Tax=Amycolatopsis sp. cg5 TaxID=3238802 RepID=UPI003524481F
MSEPLGSRERRKLQTRRAISEAAIALFVDRGFDHVSVAEVAVAAEVSKMTVFNYFATKEDLVLYRVEGLFEQPASQVREREPGESPVAALRRNFLRGLAEREPATGLNDDDGYLAFQHLVMGSPTLKLRLIDHGKRTEQALACAFTEVLDAFTAKLAAAQVIAVQYALVCCNLTRVLGGQSAADLYPSAVDEAECGFGMLLSGLRDTALV